MNVILIKLLHRIHRVAKVTKSNHEIDITLNGKPDKDRILISFRSSNVRKNSHYDNIGFIPEMTEPKKID